MAITTPSWTSHPEAMIHLASCVRDPLKVVIRTARYAQTVDEWRDSDDRRWDKLEAIRTDWCADRAGFSFQDHRAGAPTWGTPEWEAMRADYIRLLESQPTVEDAIRAAVEAAANQARAA